MNRIARLRGTGRLWWWPAAAAAVAVLGVLGTLVAGEHRQADRASATARSAHDVAAPADEAGWNVAKGSGATYANVPDGTTPAATDDETGATVADWTTDPATWAAEPELASFAGVNPKSRPYTPPSATGGEPLAPAGEGVAALAPLPAGDVPAGTPATAPIPSTGRAPAAPEYIRSLVARYFPADQVDNALAIAHCESTYRTDVVSAPNRNGTIDRGLWQLNDGGTQQGLAVRLGADPRDLSLALDQDWATRAAARLYSERGWQPWTCARKLGIYPGS